MIHILTDCKTDFTKTELDQLKLINLIYRFSHTGNMFLEKIINLKNPEGLIWRFIWSEHSNHTVVIHRSVNYKHMYINIKKYSVCWTIKIFNQFHKTFVNQTLCRSAWFWMFSAVMNKEASRSRRHLKCFISFEGDATCEWSSGHSERSFFTFF